MGEASPRPLRLSAVLTPANSCHKFLVWTGPLAFSVCMCMLRVIIYLFIFDWKISYLQHSIGFCHTSTWISHRHTYVLSLLNLRPTPSHLPRLSQSRATGFALGWIEFCPSSFQLERCCVTVSRYSHHPFLSDGDVNHTPQWVQLWLSSPAWVWEDLAPGLTKLLISGPKSRRAAPPLSSLFRLHHQLCSPGEQSHWLGLLTWSLQVGTWFAKIHVLVVVSPHFSFTIIFQVVGPHRFHHNLYEEKLE